MGARWQTRDEEQYPSVHFKHNGCTPLKLSLAKGERATSVTWIGVNFKLVAPDYDFLLVTLPERFMSELQKQ